MTENEKSLLIGAAQTIANYCRNHICTDCPLNIGDKNDTIIKAHCVCDYNILHLPSTWKIEELKGADGNAQ
jgi:hypothetical protein